jgi:hypothetical protein
MMVLGLRTVIYFDETVQRRLQLVGLIENPHFKAA